MASILGSPASSGQFPTCNLSTVWGALQPAGQIWCAFLCRSPLKAESGRMHCIGSHEAPDVLWGAVRKYEAHGRLAAQQAMDGRPPITVPARAKITVDLPVPASWSGKRRDAALRGEVRPTSRPDTDNYIKAALDQINAIVVTDDSLVVHLVDI